jgi:hypothetical protein
LTALNVLVIRIDTMLCALPRPFAHGDLTAIRATSTVTLPSRSARYRNRESITRFNQLAALRRATHIL